MGQTILAIIFLLIGILSLTYNKACAREWAQTWGRGIKHGYELGRFISIFGGIMFVLFGLLMMSAKR